MTPPIAILGAGPSGLALGRLLEVANIAFIIFERDESAIAEPSRRGGILDIHAESGQVALQEAGLLDQFKSLARYDVATTVADAQGKVYARFGEKGGDSDRPEIDRKDLRALLLSSIPADKVRWGSPVQLVQRETDGSMSVHFVDGTIESGFQLVVGADGAWSKARSAPENQFHSAAVSLAGEGNYMALGEGKQIVILKLGDGSYHIGAGLHLPESWGSEHAAHLQDPSALRQWLLRDGFADWPPVHTDMIRHSDGDFRAWPLYAMPTESLSWQAVPGITLIGDAAHVTTSFVGEGVNIALYDSLQLAQQIIKHGLNDLPRAVSEYEELMLPRGIDIIKRSTKSGELFFAPGTPKGWLKAFAGIDSA